MSVHENQHYNLIATLHDHLEDVDTFERYLDEVRDHPEYAEIWQTMLARANEAVALIRQNIRTHVEATRQHEG
jgi:hypothetical protein